MMKNEDMVKELDSIEKLGRLERWLQGQISASEKLLKSCKETLSKCQRKKLLMRDIQNGHK